MGERDVAALVAGPQRPMRGEWLAALLREPPNRCRVQVTGCGLARGRIEADTRIVAVHDGGHTFSRLGGSLASQAAPALFLCAVSDQPISTIRRTGRLDAVARTEPHNPAEGPTWRAQLDRGAELAALLEGLANCHSFGFGDGEHRWSMGMRIMAGNAGMRRGAGRLTATLRSIIWEPRP